MAFMKSEQGYFFILQNQSETLFQNQILVLYCIDLIESNYRPLLYINTLKIAILFWNLFMKSNLFMTLLCCINNSFCWKKRNRKHVFTIKVNKILSTEAEFMIYFNRPLGFALHNLHLKDFRCSWDSLSRISSRYTIKKLVSLYIRNQCRQPECKQT